MYEKKDITESETRPRGPRHLALRAGCIVRYRFSTFLKTKIFDFFCTFFFSQKISLSCSLDDIYNVVIAYAVLTIATLVATNKK